MNPLVTAALVYGLVLLSWERGGWLFWWTLLLIWLALFSWRPRRELLPPGAGLLAAGLVLALWLYTLPNPGWQEGQRVKVTGIWLETAPTPYGWKGILDSGSGPILVYTGGEIRPGARAEVEGKVERPPAALNPGQFDYRRYLWHRSIGWQLKAQQVKDLGTDSRWRTWLGELRRGFSQQALASAPGESGQVLAAMVWGQDQQLNSQLRERISRAGLAHLLSVSGFHVSLLAVPLWLWSRRLGGSPWWRLGGAFGLALFYGVLAGFEPPVVRALVMLALAMLGRELGRGRSDEAGLALALIFTTLTQPLLVTEAGFQLTFLATWALLIPGRRLKGPLAWLLLPLLVQLYTLPVVIYHFHYYNPWSVPANLLLTPLATLALWLGFLAGSLGWFWPPLAAALYPAAALPVLLLLTGVRLSAALPGANLAWSGWPAAATACSLLAGAWLLRGGWRSPAGLWFRGWCWRLLPACLAKRLALGLMVLTLVGYWFWPQPALQVTWLAVGEGFAAVFQTPAGSTYLVDAGPADKRVLGPYLAALGIERLQGVIITHPHADHYGGLEELVGKVRIDWLAAGPGAWQEPALAALGRAWQQQGSRLLSWSEGKRLELAPGLDLKVLLAAREGEDWNERSLVLELKQGEKALLFTGDLPGSELDRLVERYRPGQLLAVTMPHHGSRDGLGQSWLERWQPRLAVIPVGPNRYGHPHQETLQRLLAARVLFLRTDQQGAISLSWPEAGKVELSYFRQEEN